MALMSDEAFKPWVEKYAADEQLFFDDFSKAFAKLIANGSEAKTEAYTPGSQVWSFSTHF
jgi:catalase (peroxidase I)